MLARRALLLWAVGGQFPEDFPPPPILPTPDTPLERVMNIRDSTRFMQVADRTMVPMSVAPALRSMSAADSLRDMLVLERDRTIGD